MEIANANYYLNYFHQIIAKYIFYSNSLKTLLPDDCSKISVIPYNTSERILTWWSNTELLLLCTSCGAKRQHVNHLYLMGFIIAPRVNINKYYQSQEHFLCSYYMYKVSCFLFTFLKCTMPHMGQRWNGSVSKHYWETGLNATQFS